MLWRERLPCLRKGNGLARLKGVVSWPPSSRLGGRGASRLGRSSGACPVEESSPLNVSRISSLNVGLRSAGWVSARETGLVRADRRCSLEEEAGLLKEPCFSSRETGLWDAGRTGNRSRLEPGLRGLGLRCIGTTCTRVNGLIGLGLGPCSARIWAFWMAMRSHETRPAFEGPGGGLSGSKEGAFGRGGEYLVAGNISGV